MRLLTFFSFLVASFGFSHLKNPSMDALDGTWIPVRQQFAGTELPATGFEKQTLAIKDSDYVVTAESVDKGALKYAGGKMDIYGREGVNAGKHFMAIYKIEKEQLTICYNLKGDVYPASFETKGQPLYFLSTFKKE